LYVRHVWWKSDENLTLQNRITYASDDMFDQTKDSKDTVLNSNSLKVKFQSVLWGSNRIRPILESCQKKFLTPTFFVFSRRFRTPRTRLSKKNFVSVCLSVILSFCDSVNTITQQRSNLGSSLKCQNVGIWNRKRWLNCQPREATPSPFPRGRKFVWGKISSCF
jgi:hypothetical protein